MALIEILFDDPFLLFNRNFGKAISLQGDTYAVTKVMYSASFYDGFHHRRIKEMSKGRTTPGYECYFYGPIVAKYTPSLQTNKIYIHCYVPFSSPLFLFFNGR